MKISIAFFISPHGFGHAARSAAIMESLNEINSNLEFNIFTLVPKWFFINSNISNFKYYEFQTDIGLVQKTALKEDIYKTIEKLNEYYPLQNFLVDKISSKLQSLNCKLVICDISPLGIITAGKLGIKSILVENFTWDWIYANYKLNDKNLNSHIAYLKELFNNTDYRIKTNPVCYNSHYDLITNPVSRKPKKNREQIRHSLNIPEHNSLAMITLGGINSNQINTDKLFKFEDINFILPGGSDKFTNRNNIILLPHNSDYHHPDLINASDFVIGKLGYSTLAEVYNSGKVFGYITRSKFPESVALEEFVKSNMKGLNIKADEFENLSWVNKIDKLLSLENYSYDKTNGADQAAMFINNLIN